MIASGGHPSIHHTLVLVGDSYYWPYLKDDVEAYVRTCIVCQQHKIEQGAPARLLVPRSIDFIVGLLTNEECINAVN